MAAKRVTKPSLVTTTGPQLDRILDPIINSALGLDYFSSETERLASCCAFASLGGLEAPEKPKEWTQAQYHAVIIDQIISDLANGPGFIATTIQTQVKEAAILRAIGFKAIKSFKNPGTRNTITLWLCIRTVV